MNEWYVESISTKKKIITDAWENLGIINMHLELTPKEESNESVGADGSIRVFLMTMNGVEEIESFSYRMVHKGSEQYIRHALKTLAFRVAKKYFCFPGNHDLNG